MLTYTPVTDPAELLRPELDSRTPQHEARDSVWGRTLARASYERQIAAVEARMEEAFRDAPEAEALLSIPRLGTVMAAVFLGALGDPRAYETSRQALRVAGLSLTVHESGRRHGKP